MTLDIFFDRYLITIHAIVVAIGLVLYVTAARALLQVTDTFLGRPSLSPPFVLAIAGSVAAKKHVPESVGTFPTDGGTFVVLLVGVVVIVGALTFLPAVALGPIVEHLQMYGGKVY